MAVTKNIPSHDEKVWFSHFGKLEYFGLVNNHDHVWGEYLYHFY